MGKALEDVRIIDFTHVQSGPTCTQLLAWFGADVIKVERAAAGDITREQPIGRDEWTTDPSYATPAARLPHLKDMFAEVECWTMTRTKFQAIDVLNKYDIPCGPILSMKEMRESRRCAKPAQSSKSIIRCAASI
jgi:crotonobetainyl-CoA:carnitine CoA-transferase CaiB-like acyl-CoA transferase